MAAIVPEPFLASKLKVERARQHIGELDELLRNHYATHPPVSTFIEAKDGKDAQIHVRGSAPPPVVGAIVGDAVHNLRAALDLMAVSLVELRGQNSKSVYFPFCEQEVDLDLMIKKRNFHRAGPESVALLESLKPFKGGNIALRAIHDLDIQDKHHRLIPSTNMMTTPEVYADTSTWPPVIRMVEGSVPEIAVSFPTDSVFAGREIVPTLHELVELVEGTLEAFAALSANP
ncbi:hypothetical protein OVY29_12425 [Sphingopyxis sp. SE2]|uniref:hypothetical protein n=1 Tax=Sphingopyxis sp. SE2 TaxID=1586240 RepID=UPI0028C20CCE|nr:hypothetical protein [Sphingopyxis sp. SE2]MDT7529471.1 hypothetical protein [Sphingopyxis sp. SE2]